MASHGAWITSNTGKAASFASWLTSWSRSVAPCRCMVTASLCYMALEANENRSLRRYMAFEARSAALEAS